MSRIDKKAKYDEFTRKDGKECIGGYEIKKAWESMSGWYWIATKLETKNKDKSPFIWYGYVQGLENEWGTWYDSDMKLKNIWEIPIENWGHAFKR